MSVPEAIALVEVATKATTAYHRPDLTARLGRTTERLKDPAVRVLVVGEFKQGKSQLVNSLVSAPVCPVDDDVATSVVTMVRHADTPSVALVRVGDGNGTPERTEVPLGELAAYVSEAGNPGNRLRPAPRGRRHPAHPAGRRPGAGRHPRCRRPGVGARGRDHGRARLRGRGHHGVRRRAGVHPPRAGLPRRSRAHVPERGVRAHQDRPLPALATHRRARPRPSRGRRHHRRPHPGVVGRPPGGVAHQEQAAQRGVRLPGAHPLPPRGGAGPRGPAGPPLHRARRARRVQAAHDDAAGRARGTGEPRARRRPAGRAGAGAGRRHAPEGPDRALADHPQRRGGRPRRRRRARPARPAAADQPGGRGAGRRGRSRAGLGPVRRVGAPGGVRGRLRLLRAVHGTGARAGVARGADVRRGRRDRPARAGRGAPVAHARG